jgi:hypothetical protein
MTPPRRCTLLLALLLAAAPAARARAQAGGDTLQATASAETRRSFGVDSLAFRGLAADAGRIWPLRIEPTTIVELRADLGPVSPNVRLVPTLSFWASRFHPAEVRRLARQIEKVCAAQHGTDCPALDLGEVNVSDLSLGLDAQVTLRQRGRLIPYFSLGGAMHLLNGQGDAIDGTFVEGLLDAIAPGIQAAGGVEVPLGSALRLYGEGRAVLGSDVRYVGLMVGGSWRLPVAPPPPTNSNGDTGR